MKRIITLCFAIIGLCCYAMALPVDQETTKAIASKFMGTNNVQLSTTYTTDSNVAAFYVFNTNDGFVIVSADDCETPIIGYPHEGRFDPNNVPVQMEDYLRDFVARIQYGIENHVAADELTAKQWEMVKSTGRLSESKSNQAVGPLLTEKWHQGCLYNSLCPALSGPCGHDEVCCVAVAMAQIMHYWGYPASGWGSNSYFNQGIELSADFGNTTYDWEHMPDSLTENSSDAEIEAVATLLYHCGVSVNMEYSSNGSTASSTKVPDAWIQNFDYSRQLHRDRKGNDNEVWLTKLKDCLDLQRPIYYSGQGSAGGHAFVCDGYDDNDLLHFNWGWGGNGDGYFALGNLNPIGYSFNNNNYAIFDIIPEYEPCVVAATTFPPDAGSIEGTGEYHFGVQCTLTATPNETCKFRYWKKDDRIISQESSYSFEVKDDVDNLTAYFSLKPLKEITTCHAPDTNDVNSPYVFLSWDYGYNTEWPLLKEFEIKSEDLITTDNEYIYTAKKYGEDHPCTFGKYTMDGDSVEFFHIEGARPDGLTCDGNYFYCSKNTASYDVFRLYRYDFTNKTLVDSTYVNLQFGLCAYDSYYDGFWLLQYVGLNKTARLVDRQGQTMGNQQVTTYDNLYGFGGFTAEDGNPHLLTVHNPKYITDINLQDGAHNTFCISSSNPGEHIVSACLGKYDNKDALFEIICSYSSSEGDYKIRILEIKSHLAPILHYRLYRAKNEGDTIMLADEWTETSFTDTTWNNASAGEYRFGIIEVYYNGVESEIIWSDPIVKADHGINENNGDSTEAESSVQKIIENGHIFIIKDGKRYNVSGQQLNPR